MNYLEALSRRYSVKKFNPEMRIPQDVLLNILESGKLAASSLGLQPYKIFVVESDDLKQKLVPAFYNPSQISTCSHLVVIVSKKVIEENYTLKISKEEVEKYCLAKGEIIPVCYK